MINNQCELCYRTDCDCHIVLELKTKNKKLVNALERIRDYFYDDISLTVYADLCHSIASDAVGKSDESIDTIICKICDRPYDNVIFKNSCHCWDKSDQG